MYSKHPAWVFCLQADINVLNSHSTTVISSYYELHKKKENDPKKLFQVKSEILFSCGEQPCYYSLLLKSNLIWSTLICVLNSLHRPLIDVLGHVNTQDYGGTEGDNSPFIASFLFIYLFFSINGTNFSVSDQGHTILFPHHKHYGIILSWNKMKYLQKQSDPRYDFLNILLLALLWCTLCKLYIQM